MCFKKCVSEEEKGVGSRNIRGGVQKERSGPDLSQLPYRKRRLLIML